MFTIDPVSEGNIRTDDVVVTTSVCIDVTYKIFPPGEIKRSSAAKNQTQGK